MGSGSHFVASIDETLVAVWLKILDVLKTMSSAKLRPGFNG